MKKLVTASCLTFTPFTVCSLLSEHVSAKENSAQHPLLLAKRLTNKGKSLGLEQLIESNIKKKRKTGLLTKREKTGWSFRNLDSGAYLATINAEIPMQCASMEKPFLAQLYFHDVKAGRRRYTRESKKMMVLMLQYSNNHATNWFFKQLGGPRKVERRLKKHYGHVYRHIHFVEHIPRGGKAYRNKVAPNDYSRFLYYLWHNKFPYSKTLKSMMRLPNNDRIDKGIYGGKNHVLVYNKTGTTAMLCGDMGIVHIKDPHGKTFTYSMAGAIESTIIQSPYTRWARSRGRIIIEVSKLAYHYAVQSYL